MMFNQVYVPTMSVTQVHTHKYKQILSPLGVQAS